jgi:ankyrin repeat protein
VAAKIIELGGQTDVSDHQGRTVLHLAAVIDGMGYRLEHLLRPPFSLDVNARDHCEATPLHHASGNSEFNVWTLIKAGALISAKDLRLCNPLHQAAKCGQSNIVGLLTEAFRNQSISINEVDLDGRSALHHASQSGNPESVRLLIEAGADVALQDERGRTPLHAAAEFDGLSERENLYHLKSPLVSANGKCYARRVIQLLIAAGADPMIVDAKGHRPSDLEARSGCGTVLDELRHIVRSLHIEPLNSLSAALTTMGDTELQTLVDKLKVPNNDVGLFEAIIATGNERLAEKFAREKKLEIFHENGNSALHYVASHGLTSMMECLLPLVEDMTIALPSILKCASKRDLCNIEMVELLSRKVAKVQRISSLTPSLASLASGKHWWHPHALSILLKAGVPTETNELDETPPLHTAVGSMHSNYCRDQTLEILLRHGADPNGVCTNRWQRDRDDRPLNYAIASHRDISVLQLLIDHGASICDGYEPPVYTALRRNHIPALEMLLKAGADPNGTNDNCPLIQAAETESCSSTAVIELLLRYGADPSKPIDDGSSTVLHEIAATNGNMRPIVAFGCDLNTRDENGRTPLMRACMYHIEDESDDKFVISKVSHLLAGGADATLVDQDESTALHHAILNYNLDSVRQLLAHSPLVSTVNSEGHTPLQCALKGYADYIGLMPTGYEYDDVLSNIFFQIIHELLDAGADPLDIMPDGRTALHCIASRIMDYSNVDREAQIELDDGRDNFGEACDLYRLFLNAGCDPEARDRSGETPIFHFVKGTKTYHGDPELDDDVPRPTAREDVEWLARKHSIHSVNDRGDSLLHAIARRDPQDLHIGVLDGDDAGLFQIFIGLGLSPWQENGQGQTPLDIASTCQKRSILALFSRDD